jgi:regulator of sigma E protease
MEILIKILQLILALSLLVFVHELGHYFTARMFKIRVEKFYLFFDAGGFSFFKFKIGETTFGLGWVPFGGYCKIAGMIDESLDTKALKQPAQPWEFRSKPAWQRLIVMVGGVVMNLVMACVIYIGMSWTWGDSYVDNRDLKWGYSFNELAHEIGFRDGDRVVTIDGAAAEGDFSKIHMAIVLNKHTTVGVERDGKQLNVEVTEEHEAAILQSQDFMRPRFPFVVAGIAADSSVETQLAAGDSLVAFNGVKMSFTDEFRKAFASVAGEMSNVDATVTVVRDSMGVRVERTLPVSVMPGGQLGVYLKNAANFFPVHTIEYSFSEAIPAGFREAGRQIGDYWKQLKKIVSPQTEAYKSVGSLITIGNLFPGEWNWYMFWYWTAFLSIILAVMNILPIPALDGGHVLFLLWEVVTGRKPSDKFLERAQVVGMVLLIALLILAFWNDIYRFFLR